MNILTDVLPAAVEIAGKKYKINPDFRTCLKVILAFEDNELTPQEKQIILINNLFPVIPEDVPQALQQASLFLNGGETREESAGPRVFSFSKDSNMIFSAIHQTHGIDLQEVSSLHWWKFLAFFMDLGIDTTFCDVVGRRKRLKTGKATKDDMKIARENPDLYELPSFDDRTLEEKEMAAEFDRKVEEARKRREAASVT